MFEKVDSYEVKTKLPELLRRVESGETITISNRGNPIADIVPSRSNDRVKAKAAINNIMQHRKNTISDAELNDLIDDGRK